MKRQFKVTIERKGDDYIARCRDWPDVVAHGSSLKDALEKIKAVIIKKFDDGSDDGTAAKPHPVPSSPRGPIIIVERSHEKPDS
jgi:predicted RNase H-like HicB family nuclease